MQRINDRYEFNPATDELGKGGFGRVFKAHDTLLDRQVVLKMAEKGNLPDKYSLVKEISRVIDFNHPNLVRYYDAILMHTTNQFGEEIEYQIGVMEYVSGGDLKGFLENPKPSHLHEVVEGIIQGLAYLHQRNIIHRDIKPGNILLQPHEGSLIPKICDFGISKTVGSEATALSNVIGTFEYMSPEQLGNNPDQMISTNADLWSLGVLLYELFTGELPFGSRRGGTTDAKIIGNILAMEIPEGINRVEQPYRKVIEQCLIKNASDRAPDAAALLTTIEGGGTSAPVAEPEVPKAEPVPKVEPIAEAPPVVNTPQSLFSPPPVQPDPVAPPKPPPVAQEAAETKTEAEPVKPTSIQKFLPLLWGAGVLLFIALSQTIISNLGFGVAGFFLFMLPPLIGLYIIIRNKSITPAWGKVVLFLGMAGIVLPIGGFEFLIDGEIILGPVILFLDALLLIGLLIILFTGRNKRVKPLPARFLLITYLLATFSFIVSFSGTMWDMGCYGDPFNLECSGFIWFLMFVAIGISIFITKGNDKKAPLFGARS